MHVQSNQNVYIVDPDEAVRDAVQHLLDSCGIEVEAFPDGESFLKKAARTASGCLIIESELPGLNGLTVLSRLREIGNDIPVLVLNSSGDSGIARAAVERGAESVINKPLAHQQLLRHLASLLQPTPPGLLSLGAK